MKFGARLGKALSELVTIVHPVMRQGWVRDSKHKTRMKPVEKDRPWTRERIRQWILKLARENDWGYLSIPGELLKLGITVGTAAKGHCILGRSGRQNWRFARRTQAIAIQAGRLASIDRSQNFIELLHRRASRRR